VCGIPAEFHVTFPSDVRLPPDVDTQVYRIVQEALQNIRKHSNAMTVSVLMEQRESEVVLIIEDDGRGFEVDQHRTPGRTSQNMGLVSMEERALLLGGSVEIESSPGEGTSVFVRVPLPKLTPLPG
jgi:signal transduction histidine kinase